MNVFELKDLFNKFLHESKQFNNNPLKIEEVTEHGVFNFKYTIRIMISDNEYKFIYKSSTDSDKFNRKGRFNNNFYSNTFLLNNVEIENDFSVIVEHIKIILSNIDINSNEKYFNLIKNGNYTYKLNAERIYQLSFKKDLLVIKNIDNDLFIPEYFYYKKIDSFYKQEVVFSMIVQSIHNILKFITKERRLKYDEIIPFYEESFNISEEKYINENLKLFSKYFKAKKL